MLFKRPICANVFSVKPEPNPSTTKTEIEPQTQDWITTLKPAGTVRKRTDEEKTWDKKGSAITRNYHSCLYIVFKENGNLMINRCHLIPTNEKFIFKHDYEYIIEPSETASRKTVVPPKTDIPSNIVTPLVNWR